MVANENAIASLMWQGTRCDKDGNQHDRYDRESKPVADVCDFLLG